LHRFGGFPVSGFVRSVAFFGSFGCLQNRKMFRFSFVTSFACASDLSTETSFRDSGIVRLFTGRGGRPERAADPPEDAPVSPELWRLSRSRLLRSPLEFEDSALECDDDLLSFECDAPVLPELGVEDPLEL
jgi:hypothetical protein